LAFQGHSFGSLPQSLKFADGSPIDGLSRSHRLALLMGKSVQ